MSTDCGTAGRSTGGFSRALLIFSVPFMLVGLIALFNPYGNEPYSAQAGVTPGHGTTDDHADKHPYVYEGLKECKKCHMPWYRSWRSSDKGDAWKSLLPGHGDATKSRAGLDPGKDYTADERCLACHTTGYGKPGGYATPSQPDSREAREAEQLQGVTCEACHGPGSGYVVAMRDVRERERTYDRKEMVSLGRVVVTQTVCNTCHHEGAICQVGVDRQHAESYDPNVDLSNRDGYHEEFELKFLRSGN